MTEVTGGDIEHLAELSRLSLSDEEKRKFSAQLPKIVEFVEELSKAKLDDSTDGVALIPMSELREDEVSGDRLRLDQLKDLAPKWTNNHVEVPAVFGGDDD